MKLIGLTGGIGSGKTLVAGIFRTLGIPVYESDAQAKVLMHSEALKTQIKTLFGSEAYKPDLSLNREWIAKQVFGNPALLKALNAIVHPAVFTDMSKWVMEESQQTAPYVIQESAILFEEGLTGLMTAVILVSAPEELRIERVMKRDNVSVEQVLERIKNQWPEEKKIPIADFVIYNDGQRPLIEQVRDVDIMIRSLNSTS